MNLLASTGNLAFERSEPAREFPVGAPEAAFSVRTYPACQVGDCKEEITNFLLDPPAMSKVLI